MFPTFLWCPKLSTKVVNNDKGNKNFLYTTISKYQHLIGIISTWIDTFKIIIRVLALMKNINDNALALMLKMVNE